LSASPCPYGSIHLGGENKHRVSMWADLVRTLMIGSCPLIPALSFVFLMSTTRSRPLRFPGTVKLRERSRIVCVHLYGREACSSTSRARAAASAALSAAVSSAWLLAEYEGLEQASTGIISGYRFRSFVSIEDLERTYSGTQYRYRKLTRRHSR
jgi:hypothetical protein